VSRRDQIRMTEDEVHEYFDQQKVINVASIGPNGRPHLAPLWYYPYESGGRDLDVRDVAEGEEPATAA